MNGHGGAGCEQGVYNDATLANLGTQAVISAAAGEDFIAHSAAMDGPVQASRQSLAAAGFTVAVIMSHPHQSASSFLRPFRYVPGTA
ncbi:hypothetical protein [Salmonella enterica]|uniref:hypothetical protein n=1 Tax=Salmonella enterica TaxID=28901 RepID=UPI00398C7E29